MYVFPRRGIPRDTMGVRNDSEKLYGSGRNPTGGGKRKPMESTHLLLAEIRKDVDAMISEHLGDPITVGLWN